MSVPGPTRIRPPSRRRLVRAVAAVSALAVVVALGPRVRFDEVWIEPSLPLGDDASGEVMSEEGGPGGAVEVAHLRALEAWLAATEVAVAGIREGDEKGIVWADPDRPMKTGLSLVYLHGFSADRHELEPVISDLGRELAANVYFSRLTGHGRDGRAMADATAASWLADAVEALAIGERIGERVVVIGTSTGGTLGVWLAGREEARGRLHALVLISPNFHPADRSARVLLYPWGTELAKALIGRERCFPAVNERQERHWTTCYPTPVLGQMMALVEGVRTMDPGRVRVPTLVLFDPEDAVVDPVETAEAVARMSGTRVEMREITSTSDPAHHVLAGDIVSPESNAEARTVIASFLRTLPDR